MQPTCVPDAGETRGIARKGQRNPAACWRRAAIHLGSDRASGQGRTRGPRLTSVSAPWTLTEVASAWSASSALSGASPAPPCRGEAAGASSSSMDMRRHRAHSQEGPSLLGRPAGTPPSLSPGWEKIRTTNTTAHMLYSFSLNFQSSFRTQPPGSTPVQARGILHRPEEQSRTGSCQGRSVADQPQCPRL